MKNLIKFTFKKLESRNLSKKYIIFGLELHIIFQLELLIIFQLELHKNNHSTI